MAQNRVQKHPEFTNCFQDNLKLILRELGLSEASHGNFYLKLKNPSTKAVLFVSSEAGKYGSAAILQYFFQKIVSGDAIQADVMREEIAILKQVYAEFWDDEPGTGKHPVIDFIRNAAENKLVFKFSIVHIGREIDFLWRTPEISVNMANGRQSLEWIISELKSGKLRVRTEGSNWKRQEWLERAILLYQKLSLKQDLDVPSSEEAPLEKFEIGTYVHPDVTIDMMTSIGNGVYIAENTSIHPHVHVGDYVVIEANATLLPGLFISENTPIYNPETGEVFYGVIPKGSVVAPGSIPMPKGKASFKNREFTGTYSLNCGIITKTNPSGTFWFCEKFKIPSLEGFYYANLRDLGESGWTHGTFEVVTKIVRLEYIQSPDQFDAILLLLFKKQCAPN